MLRSPTFNNFCYVDAIVEATSSTAKSTTTEARTLIQQLLYDRSVFATVCLTGFVRDDRARDVTAKWQAWDVRLLACAIANFAVDQKGIYKEAMRIAKSSPLDSLSAASEKMDGKEDAWLLK